MEQYNTSPEDYNIQESSMFIGMSIVELFGCDDVMNKKKHTPKKKVK